MLDKLLCTTNCLVHSMQTLYESLTPNVCRIKKEPYLGFHSSTPHLIIIIIEAKYPYWSFVCLSVCLYSELALTPTSLDISKLTKQYRLKTIQNYNKATTIHKVNNSICSFTGFMQFMINIQNKIENCGQACVVMVVT